MSIESIIKEWRSFDSHKKLDVIDQLKHLFDAEMIEKELNRESEQISDAIQKEEGNDQSKTQHTAICGDFLSSEIVNLMDEKGFYPNLIVTSPPYNSGVDYGDDFNDNKNLTNYKDFLKKFLHNCDLFLKKGGRLVINLRDISIGNGFRYPIIVHLFNILCLEMFYSYRGLHIWYKGREESSSAWGSWIQSRSPSIIDLYEYVFVFQKGTYPKGVDNLSKTEFIEDIMGVWKIRPVKKIAGKKKTNVVNHPCPFPVELPKRIIKLYSHVGDLVLDPFAGILTTTIAAAQTGRNSICVESNKEYVNEGCRRFKSIYKPIFQTAVLQRLRKS